MIIEVTKELCVYCLEKATVPRNTGRYIVGLCDLHKDLDNKDIDEILGDVKIKKRGLKTLIP
jgi:hypothetical protein